MTTTRRVLHELDLEHLLRGGVIRIKDSDTEICLADIGYSMITDIVMRVVGGESAIGKPDARAI